MTFVRKDVRGKVLDFDFDNDLFCPTVAHFAWFTCNHGQSYWTINHTLIFKDDIPLSLQVIIVAKTDNNGSSESSILI